MAITRKTLELLQLLNESREGRYTHELAEQLDVDPRSIRRWVHEVNALAKAPLPQLPLRLPRLRLARHQGRSWVMLLAQQPNEGLFHLAAIDLAGRALNKEAGKELYTALDEEAQLDPQRLISDTFKYVPSGDVEYHNTHHAAVLFNAMSLGRRVDIKYQASGSDKAVRRRVEPYNVVFFGGALYLAGFNLETEKVEALPFQGLLEVKIQQRNYERPANFNPASLFLGGFEATPDNANFVEVILAFEDDVVEEVRARRWAADQRWTKRRDRHAIKLKTTLSEPLIRWVLSWGASVEVLAPTELKHSIARRVGDLRRLYRL